VKSALVSASAALDQAEERYAETVVHAPITGRIIQKRVEEGQIISSATLGFSRNATLPDGRPYHRAGAGAHQPVRHRQDATGQEATIVQMHTGRAGSQVEWFASNQRLSSNAK